MTSKQRNVRRKHRKANARFKAKRRDAIATADQKTRRKRKAAV